MLYKVVVVAHAHHAISKSDPILYTVLVVAHARHATMQPLNPTLCSIKF